MRHDEMTQKQSAAFLAAALAAPLIQTASACTWPAALAVGSACLLTCWAVTRQTAVPGKWLLWLQWVWACVIASEVLHWSAYCWPSHPDGYGAPLILLLLAGWAASGGRERAARAGCALLWPLALLLGAVLFSGIPEIEAENLKPSWQMPDASLVTVFLFPLLIRPGRGKGNGRILTSLLLIALLTSVVTAGVLSPNVSRGMQAPFYELSRSLSLLGVAERFESLVAAALTIGYFSTISLLLSRQETVGKGKLWVWIGAGLSGLLFLLDIRIDSRLLALGSILTWVILPAVCHLKNNFQKRENKG